jgi:hypothetical protein
VQASYVLNLIEIRRRVLYLMENCRRAGLLIPIGDPHRDAKSALLTSFDYRVGAPADGPLILCNEDRACVSEDRS